MCVYRDKQYIHKYMHLHSQLLSNQKHEKRKYGMCCRIYASLPSIDSTICYFHSSERYGNKFVSLWHLRSAILFNLSNQ